MIGINRKDIRAVLFYFHHFAWLVAFTNSSQIISTHLLTVLTISAILITVMRKPLQAQPNASYFFKEPRRLRICIYKLKEESL